MKTNILKTMQKNIILILLATASHLFAQGPLTPPGAPAPTQKSLQEIWDRMNTLEAQNTALQTQNQNLINLTLQSALPSTQYVWEKSVIDPAGATTSSLAFAPNGRPIVAYQSTNLELKYAAFNGTTWQITTVSGPGNGKYCSLAVGPAGFPSIASYNPTAGNLVYSSFNGTTWNTDDIDKTADVGAYCSLKFLPSGQPSIAYYDITNGDLKYTTFDGSTWNHEVVSSTNNVGTGAALAISPDGEPSISYYDSTTSTLWLAKKQLSTWNFTNLGNAKPGAIGRTSIAYSPSGSVSTASHASILANPLATKLAFDGTPTTTDTIGATSLVFTRFGQPIIGYRDLNGGHQSIITRIDSTWVTTVLETETNPATDTGAPALATGPNKLPAASFATNVNGLSYAFMNPFAAP